MIETSNALQSTPHTDSRNVKDTMVRVLVLLIILVTLNDLNFAMDGLHATLS
jgi:hypothetical protein